MQNNIILEDLEEIFNRDIEWNQLENKTVLITGPNGMLASYVMYMLIYLNEAQNYNIKIIAMARSLNKFFDRFGDEGKASYIRVLTDSINEPINIDDDVDYIIHAASLASPQYYGVCPVDVLSPNVIGTYYLLKLATEKKVRGFLLFSTGDVYGRTSGIEKVTENDMGVLNPLDIHSCYSESKRMAETMCYSFRHQYGVPVRILRIWHTYAPTMNIEHDPRVFAAFMKNIVEGKNIEIKSDGRGKRTFCYIADAIAGLFTVLTKGSDGEAYNICNTEQFVSIRQLAETLVELRKDVQLKVTWVERPKNENYTENTAIGQIVPDNSKLKMMGWQTLYDIEKGFRRVYEYISQKSRDTLE